MLRIATLTALLYSGFTQAGLPLPPEPVDKSTPTQQRISLNGPGSVAVAWNTYEQLQQACVQYGVDENSLSQTQCSQRSVTYSTSRTWSNLVVLSGLQPAQKYYYRIGSTNSTTDWFMSGRAAGDPTPFTMSTYADLGVYGQDGYMTKKRSEIPRVQPALNHTTIGRLAAMADDYEFIIHPGDLAYADDWIEDPSNLLDGTKAYTAIIETFYNQLAPVSARKPYMVSPGNHEATCQEVPETNILCPAGQSNFSDFQNRFDGMMPTVFPASSKGYNSTAAAARSKAAKLALPPFWYSFDYGMAHIVMFDTETDFPSAPDQPGGSAHLNQGPFGMMNQQTQFLDADLSSVDRSVTPWLIVAGHRPWYTNGNNSGCGPCQTAFEGLFYKYGVDLAAFGHVHNLQRFAPIYNGTVDPAGLNNPKAPMYTVIGGAGNIEGHSTITPSTTGNAFAYNTNYGFGALTFHNRTHMEVNFYDSVDGSVLDNSMLIKAHNASFVVQ